jgi:hypothetical protein
VCQLGAGADEVLAVIQHDQQLGLAQPALERVEQRSGALGDSQCVGERGRDEPGIGERAQFDHPDPVGVLPDRRPGRAHGKSCLAGAACPGQRQ